jgi:septation ring formation regulator EzrA
MDKQTQEELLLVQFKSRYTYEAGDGIRMNPSPGLYLKIFSFFNTLIQKEQIDKVETVRKLESELQSLKAENERLKEQYNDLGVKFDKETERWQERDSDELDKRKDLESQISLLRESLNGAKSQLDKYDWDGGVSDTDTYEAITDALTQTEPKP